MVDNYNILDDPPASGGVLSDPIVVTGTSQAWREINTSAVTLGSSEPGSPTFSLVPQASDFGTLGGDAAGDWSIVGGGLYIVTILRNDTGSAATVHMRLARNGSFITSAAAITGSSNNSSFSTIVSIIGSSIGVVAGDSIEVYLWQPSGTPVDWTGKAACYPLCFYVYDDPNAILADIIVDGDVTPLAPSWAVSPSGAAPLNGRFFARDLMTRDFSAAPLSVIGAATPMASTGRVAANHNGAAATLNGAFASSHATGYPRGHSQATYLEDITYRTTGLVLP